MLRDPVEAKQNLIDPGFSLYSHPMFKRERGKSVGFIELLRARYLVRFGTWPLEGVTLFFVWKKKKAVETANDAGLRLGQADVKDAFHRLGMPSFLSAYFGYPGCTAEEMKMVGETVDGVELRAGDVVFPLSRSLPMGFAWSLGVMGCSKDEVARVLSEVTSIFEKIGLAMARFGDEWRREEGPGRRIGRSALENFRDVREVLEAP